MSENLIYVNGRFVSEKEPVISVFDHGFLYGDGVFEGIRAYNGRVFKLKEHVDRLFDSAKAIDLDIGISKEKMEEAILETLRVNKLTDAYIRPIVSRGNGDLGLDPRKCAKPNVFIVAKVWGSMYGDLYTVGLKGITVGVRRNAPDMLSPNIKSLNYLNNILAKIEANAKGADEAIFLDSNGYVAEGSGDNIFVIKNGEVYTPPTINNLKGITRATAIDLLKEEKIPVHVENISLFDVYTADEIFVTGTAAEAAPVVWVDGRSIGTGKPGPVTLKMVKKFEKITSTTGTPIYAAGKAPAKSAAKPTAKSAAKPAAKKTTARKSASNLAVSTGVKSAAVKKSASKTTAKPAAKAAANLPPRHPQRQQLNLPPRHLQRQQLNLPPRHLQRQQLNLPPRHP
jgi:branched-chain amino acid aminotransferase, group I